MAPSTASTHDGLTLEDVLARRVSIECHEAVAIVRDVTEHISERFGQFNIIPDLDQIYLLPAGRTEVVCATEAGEPVRRMGQLLQALLTQSETPVQLRLVISQAMAPAPAYGSIREYSDALGLFAAGAGLIALACAGAVRYVRTGNFAPATRAQVSEAANRASHVVGRAVVAGVSAVTDRLGLGRVAPGDAAAQLAPAAAPSPAARSETRRRPARLQAQPFTAFDLEPAGPLARPTADAVSPSPDSHSPDESSVDRGAAAPDLTIYAAGSDGVSPPVGIRPQLPRELPSTVKIEELSRIELIVASNGTVESVRLVNGPRGVLDAMLLSAVKAWEFHPALKDGIPVRYRKTIWIASK
jgi:Gram-negative bacterial TonB protein C-terminal